LGPLVASRGEISRCSPADSRAYLSRGVVFEIVLIFVDILR